MNISGPAAVAKPEMLFYAPGDLTVTLKKHITDEKTEISYTLCGDYFLDDFELRLIIRAPEECRNINKVKDNAIVVVA